MKNTIFIKSLIIIGFFSVLSVNAQQKKNTNKIAPVISQNINIPDHRTCGLNKHEEALINDEEYAKSFFERQVIFKQKLTEIHQQKVNGAYRRKATLYIPVAVHFPEANESERVCLEAYAQTQIDVINADYTATNADISLWGTASEFYPGLNPGSVDVEFCIATLNHPTIGDPEVVNGSPLVTIGTNGSNFGSFPETDARYAGYMNFIIKDIGSGTLGYSPLAGNIATGSAVVMNTICYGTGDGCAGITPQAPYNLGRTVTHELGHFYNLEHTFIEDGGTSCEPADGDGLADTPKVAGSSYSCPTDGTVAGCDRGENSLTMNYMDYVNDACMYMFTPDQATRMEAYFATVASDWKQNVIECNIPDSPEISFTNSTQTVNEDTDCSYTDYIVPVEIEIGASASATVTFNVNGSSTAANNIDYELVNTTVTFATGSTVPQNLTIRIFNDGFVEGDETIDIDLSLSTSGDAYLDTNADSIIITISDDDMAPTVSSTVTVFSDDFESYPDFEIGNIGNWTMLDNDGDSTYSSDNYDFTNEGYTGTFIIYNASETTPSSTENGWEAHSGDKGFYCFNSNGDVSGTPLNDDYIFTEQISLGTGSELKLWARGLTDNYSGGERFQVGVSTTDTTPASFTYLTPSPYQIPTLSWAEYTYDLSAYDNENIYITIHVVSEDEFVFMLDDVSVTTNVQNSIQVITNPTTSYSTTVEGSGILYAYDEASGDIMAGVQNNDTFDYNCTDISISRAGMSGQSYNGSTSPNFVTDKVFTVTTSNTTTSGDLTNTFYFAEAEIAGWEAAATTFTRSDLYIFREVGGTVVESVAATIGAFGSEVTLSGSFTGLEGIYYFGPQSALSVGKNNFSLFTIYPNPTNGIVSISLSSIEDVQVSLYDIRGRLISSESHTNNSGTFRKELNFGTVSSGVYLLNVKSGNKTATKKLIIQ